MSRAGEFSAMVTAPVPGGVINQAGIPFPATPNTWPNTHTPPRVVMMLAGENEPRAAAGGAGDNASAAARGLPTRDYRRAAGETLRILHADMGRKYGISAPRILIAGLNPHAGEDGYLGREELDVMMPVLRRLRAEGMNLIGPLPADTLFTPPVLTGGDCVLAMYHDRGLASSNYRDLYKGINVTLGLP